MPRYRKGFKNSRALPLSRSGFTLHGSSCGHFCRRHGSEFRIRRLSKRHRSSRHALRIASLASTADLITCLRPLWSLPLLRRRRRRPQSVQRTPNHLHGNYGNFGLICRDKRRAVMTQPRFPSLRTRSGNIRAQALPFCNIRLAGQAHNAIHDASESPRTLSTFELT